MAGWKVQFVGEGNIALRIFSNKGGAVKLVNEIVMTATMADKIAFALTEKAKVHAMAHTADAAEQEFDSLDDVDYEDA